LIYLGKKGRLLRRRWRKSNPAFDLWKSAGEEDFGLAQRKDMERIGFSWEKRGEHIRMTTCREQKRRVLPQHIATTGREQGKGTDPKAIRERP